MLLAFTVPNLLQRHAHTAHQRASDCSMDVTASTCPKASSLDAEHSAQEAQHSGRGGRLTTSNADASTMYVVLCCVPAAFLTLCIVCVCVCVCVCAAVV